MKNFKQYIKESGNAVTNVSRINAENVDATLKDIYQKVLPKVGLKQTDVAPIGSTGKKKRGESSGDLDIAVDASQFIYNNNVDKGSDVLQYLGSKVGKLTNNYSVLPGFGTVSFAWPIKNVDKKQRNKFVQVDFMLTSNMRLTKFTFWSPSSEESKWKGLYRNILLTSIASQMDFNTIKTAVNDQGEEIPAEFEKNFIDVKRGLIRGLQTRIGKTGKLLSKNKTVSTKVISSVPEEIVTLVLGPDFTVSDAKSFESLYKAIHSPKFINKKHTNDILKTCAANIKQMRGLVLPPELERL